MAMTLVSTAVAFLLGVQAPSSGAEVPVREQPHSIEIGPTFIIARLSSNGCTDKSDFNVAVHRSGRFTRLVFRRRVPDRCRALVREGVLLRWTRAELGLRSDEPITIGSPF
jgi:hypothetical protein